MRMLQYFPCKFVSHKLCPPRKILLEMSDPDPVLDMKGMTMEEISLLLKFIYTGEVVIAKDNVEQFLVE